MAIRYPFVVDLVSRRASSASRVLEVGCGEMQYRGTLPGEYTGLDLPSWTGVSRSPDVVASLDAMPLPDGSFDVVFGVAVFYYVENVQRALEECRRVLRPGGWLMAFDYTRGTTERMREQGDDLVAHSWDRSELRERLIRAGFGRAEIHDLSHRAGDDGDPPPWLRPLRWTRSRLDPEWTQWLILEARR